MNLYEPFDVLAIFEPPPPATYAVQEIPRAYMAHGLNASGNAVGVGFGGPSTTMGDAFFFDSARGQTSFIGFSSNDYSSAWGLNDRNSLVVNVWNFYRSRTVLWEHGMASELGTLGGDTWGYGINNSNRVVGWYTLTGGTLPWTRAFVHDGQRMIDLGSLAGTCSEARAINDVGTVVGRSCTEKEDHAVIFTSTGTIEDLTPGAPGIAYAISNAGFIVGCAGGEGFIRAPGKALRNVGGLPGGTGGCLLSVNDLGVAVGYGTVPTYNYKGLVEFTARAAIWTGGRLWDLSYLINRPDLQLNEALGINEAGQIVVRAFSPGGSGSFAFLLTPR